MEDPMAIDKKLIDQLLTDYKKPEDIIGENGLLKELTKDILERRKQAEMTDHLGYEKHDPAGHHRGNTRNGKSQKSLKGDFGELELETPRDRQATFDPKIVAKGQTRWTGFDDKIISMYARGMTTREIQGLRWLARDRPDLDELRNAASSIVKDGKRAGDLEASNQRM